MADQASVDIVSNDNQSDNSKGIKRPLEEDDSDNKAVKKQETDSIHQETHTDTATDDKNIFRLNPPTLIHGVAKSAPKSEEDNDSEENKEKPLLRPSLFGAASSTPFMMSFSKSAADSTSLSENPQKGVESKTAEQADSEKPKVNFLKLSTGEADRDVGFGVFGTFSDSQLHTVDFSEKGKPKGQNGEGQNYFLQFSQPSEKSEEKKPKEEPAENRKKGVSSTEKGKFVFGQNMNARVTSPSKQEGELQNAGQYVFGQNVSDRVKKEELPKDEEPTEAEQSAKSLAENAKDLESAKEKNRVKFEEVELFTGEEGEENVLQAQCKLHLFQVDKQVWVERGRGLLRLNDRVPSDYSSQMESRIVMRAQGSLRVLLNAKIWSNMIAEKVSTKNIRISAVDGDSGSVKIYLITATPNDAEQIFQGIDYRIQALKHRETTTEVTAEEEEGESNKDEPSYQMEDSRNTEESDPYEGNEAEQKRHTAVHTKSEDSKTTSTAEVTSSSKDTSD